MGSVWRAWDARRRCYVAAKLLRIADAGSVVRFVREQSLRVEHPHVVAPTSWAADDDKVLLTMDVVRGGSVAHLLGDYGPLPLPLPYVAVLVDQLLTALTAVHAHGIVHRDVNRRTCCSSRPAGVSRSCGSRISATPRWWASRGRLTQGSSWAAPDTLRPSA